MIQSGYPWPASALTGQDMALLYHVRESANPKIPINALIACAVRAVYAKLPPARNIRARRASAAADTTTKTEEAA